jgi:hypothetical protein
MGLLRDFITMAASYGWYQVVNWTRVDVVCQFYGAFHGDIEESLWN